MANQYPDYARAIQNTACGLQRSSCGAVAGKVLYKM